MQLIISEPEILLRLVVSAMLGFIIGLERERQNQPAGLRTHMILVSGATLAMTLSINLAIQFHPLVPTGDPSRLAAQVISGIGFLGAGAILRFGTSIKGLTTATSLWTMAVVGLMVGAGYYLTGIAATLFLLFILTLLNQIEKRLIPVQKIFHLLIEVQDRPGVVTEIRSKLAHSQRIIHRLGVEKDLNQQRIFVEATLQAARNELPEQIVDVLSDLQGVERIKIG